MLALQRPWCIEHSGFGPWPSKASSLKYCSPLRPLVPGASVGCNWCVAVPCPTNATRERESSSAECCWFV